MKVSVVCPFYNESLIIENAVLNMLDNLKTLPADWELVLVNDGSTDSSPAIVRKAVAGATRVKIVSYPINEGRGHALKKGIDAAEGEIIVTTEIDLSWGDGIVRAILNKFQSEPVLDVIVASPNIPGGGYKNVPPGRVLISRLGNALIRLLFTKQITMNTGMTRGYRREVIKDLPVFEKGKEFHLEVLLKLLYLGYRIGEIPAVLEWKDKKLARVGSQKRRSSSKMKGLIISHINFAVFANPIRYFWAFGALSAAAGLGFITGAFYRFWAGQVAIYMALTGFSMFIVALLLFGFGILANQNNFILRELWRIQAKAHQGQEHS